MKSETINVYMLSKHQFFIIWATWLEEQSLGHMVILRLTFWWTVKLFSTVAETSYIPTSKV